MEYLKARAKMYDIVKTAFSQPDQALTVSILDGRFAERIRKTIEHCCSLSAQCCLPADLQREIHDMSSSLKKENGAPDLLETLHVEYMRLFVNAFPTLWAPPHESYYTEKRVMGQAAMDCLHIYREDGLMLNDKGELPDHIITQLEYLHFLGLAEWNAVEDKDTVLENLVQERKRAFFEKHIMNWVPEFCGRVRSHSRVTFYRVMSRLLKNFILLENRSLTTDNLDLFEEVEHDEVKRA